MDPRTEVASSLFCRRRVPLGSVATIIAGQSPPSDTYRDTPTGLPFFQGKADFGPRHPVPRKWCVRPGKIAEPGDILVSVRAPVGPTNVADSRCCIGRGLAAIRPLPCVDRDYLLLAIRHFERDLAALGSGSTFAAITRCELESLLLPIPPIAEQRRIAAALSEQLDTAARMRAAVDCHDTCMAAFADATLQTAFADAAVAQACRVPLGDVCSIESPQVNPTQPQFGSLPHVSGENIESTTGRLLDLRSATDDGMISGKYLFEPGDVLYSKLRPYLRKVALVDFRGICSADMYPLRADITRLDPRYLKWLLLSSEFTTYADEESRRARMPKLNREQLFAFKAPMPDLPDQQRIAAALQHRFDATLSIRTMTAELAEDIGRLPAALLRRAFSPADPGNS